MQKKLTLKSIISVFTVITCLSLITGIGAATDFDHDASITMAASDEDDSVVIENNESLPEETDATYTDEENSLNNHSNETVEADSEDGRLQDYQPASDDEVSLENLTEEELKLYLELTGKEGK
ncbi:MAG: hypothetical protein KKB30_09625 [Proteobacteria bacterium]|nr:hypothetical protein [Pseudomonadota bacterium]MBU1716979.1 hypothetical protein [Pseudomonadota bacterium]